MHRLHLADRQLTQWEAKRPTKAGKGERENSEHMHVAPLPESEARGESGCSCEMDPLRSLLRSVGQVGRRYDLNDVRRIGLERAARHVSLDLGDKIVDG